MEGDNSSIPVPVGIVRLSKEICRQPTTLKPVKDVKKLGELSNGLHLKCDALTTISSLIFFIHASKTSHDPYPCPDMSSTNLSTFLSSTDLFSAAYIRFFNTEVSAMFPQSPELIPPVGTPFRGAETRGDNGIYPPNNLTTSPQ